MPRVLWSVIVLSLLLTAGSASAQLPAISSLMTITGSYTSGKEQVIGTMNGAAFSAGYESIQSTGNVAMGFNLTFSRLSEEHDENNFIDINSWITYGYGKYLIGNKTFQGYIGFAAGAHFTGMERKLGGVELPKGSDAGLALGFPLGMYWLMSEKVFLNLNYTLNYLGNSFLENDILHMAGVGLVFVLN